MNRPSMRYFLVKFVARDPISADVLENALYGSIERMFGKFGSEELRTRFIAFEESSKLAVVRCTSASVEKLRTALLLMREVDGAPLAAGVLRSSGTIRGLKVRVRGLRRR